MWFLWEIRHPIIELSVIRYRYYNVLNWVMPSDPKQTFTSLIRLSSIMDQTTQKIPITIKIEKDCGIVEAEKLKNFLCKNEKLSSIDSKFPLIHDLEIKKCR